MPPQVKSLQWERMTLVYEFLRPYPEPYGYALIKLNPAAVKLLQNLEENEPSYWRDQWSVNLETLLHRGLLFGVPLAVLEKGGDTPILIFDSPDGQVHRYQLIV